jgi:catechol 2,3-dioxygenase-like lactoylglutathione lyase family enzyme
MPIQGPGITHVCFQAPRSKSIYEKVKTFGANILSRGNVPIDRGFGITYAYAKDPNGIMFEMEHFAEPPFEQDVLIGHVALVTPDIDRLVSFYTQLLGIEPNRRIDNIKNSPKLDDIANIDSLRMRAAWFKLDNMILEMWQFQNPKTKEPSQPLPFSQIGYNTVAFGVGNLQNEFKRLSSKGVKFLSAPVQNANSSSVYARDPDGNLLLLEEIQK